MRFPGQTGAIIPVWFHLSMMDCCVFIHLNVIVDSLNIHFFFGQNTKNDYLSALTSRNCRFPVKSFRSNTGDIDIWPFIYLTLT